MRALALLVLTAASAAAQTSWRAVPEGPAVSVDGQSALGTSFATFVGAASLSAHVPAGPVAIVADVPVGVVQARSLEDVAGEPAARSDAGLGNPYLGIRLGRGPLVVSVGGRVPLAEREPITEPIAGGPVDATAAVAAMASDQYLAFEPSMLSVGATVGIDRPLSPALRLRAWAGPLYAHDTGERTDAPPPPGIPQVAPLPRGNLAGVGAAYVDAGVGGVTLTAGTSGRYDPPGGALTWEDDLRMDALVGVRANALPARPSIYVRLPAVGFSASDAVVGLSVDVPLR